MTTTEPQVTVKPTRYEVSAIPEDNRNHHHFTINVEYRGDGKWAVCQDRYCLGVDGIWEYEMRPSEREDEWLATHRFDLDTALCLAREEAPKVTVNGITVAAVLARAKGQR